MTEKPSSNFSESNPSMRSLKHFIGYELRGTDGSLGKVKDFLIDDQSLGVRYLVADTGGWFSENKVLISPSHLVHPEEHGKETAFLSTLNKKKIEKCPPIEADAPVSRRYEEEYARFHEQVPYWSTGANPVRGAGATADEVAHHGRALSKIEKCHLHSLSEIIGYTAKAIDGAAGTLSDSVVELGTWKVRYLVIDSGSWLNNKQYLIDTDWMEAPDWNNQSICLTHTRKEIRDSPKFDPSIPVNRDYEVKLYDYYGKPHRWVKLS